ncbi:MAG: iron(III) transport system permease protein, partial [Solirubrobacteraceae bacterium]|nr:iron(III) transport system permease protein [Solirubrobacteraceae bacterium]
GVAAAWCVERTSLPGRRIWTMLLVLPLGVPEFVNSFSWVSLDATRFQGFRGALLVTTLSYYPFIYLPAAAALRGSDPALEEAARSLGLGPWRTFWRVTLPQLRVAILGGGLIIALHLLAEYGAFATLRFPTFATEIFAEYQLGFDGASAALLSLVVVVLSVLFLAGELGLIGRTRYARIGSGAARARRPLDLGRATPVAVAGVGLLVALALGVPVATLVYWLIHGGSTTLPSASILGAAGTTFALSAAAALLTALIALPVAVLAVRHRSRVSMLLERSAYLARALPGIVIALALISFSIRLVHPLYQTQTLLVVAYAILFLPLALVAIRGTLVQVPPRLEEVARTLGLRPLGAFRRVTLPLIAPGLGAAAALVFLSAATELTATLLLRPTGSETLATQFWNYQTSLAFGAAAPYAALMVGICAPATYFLIRRLDTLAT